MAKLNETQKAALLGLLWGSLKRDPEHKDRKQTGFGTKTQTGLLASIERCITEFGDAPEELTQQMRAAIAKATQS